MLHGAAPRDSSTGIKNEMRAIYLIISMHAKSWPGGLLKAVLWLTKCVTHMYGTEVPDSIRFSLPPPPSLRGRCRRTLQTQQGMAEVYGGLVLRALMCVSSRARSGSHASSYLMPRHPWMISTWPRVDIGRSHYYDSPPLNWFFCRGRQIKGAHFWSSLLNSYFLSLLERNTSSESDYCDRFLIHCWWSD